MAVSSPTSSPRLAFRFPDKEELVEGLNCLNIDAFTRMCFIRARVDGRYSWLIGPQHLEYCVLPDHQRTQVDHQTNWLVPIPEEEEQEENQPHAQPNATQDVMQGIQHTLNNLKLNLYGFLQDQGYNPYHRPDFGP